MANRILNCHDGDASTWFAFTDDERTALIGHDDPTLFGMGAHPFLTLSSSRCSNGPTRNRPASGSSTRDDSRTTGCYSDIAT